MTNKVQIIGNSYPHRRSLRSMGGKWNGTDKVWVAPESDQLEVFAKENELDLEEYKGSEDLLDNKEMNYKAKAKRRAEMWSERAEVRAEKRDDFSRLNDNERDFLRLAEPIKVGHHSEKRHRKVIEKARSEAETLYGKGGLCDRAEEAKDKAEYWEKKSQYTKKELEKAMKKFDETEYGIADRTKYWTIHVDGSLEWFVWDCSKINVTHLKYIVVWLEKPSDEEFEMWKRRSELLNTKRFYEYKTNYVDLIRPVNHDYDDEFSEVMSYPYTNHNY